MSTKTTKSKAVQTEMPAVVSPEKVIVAMNEIVGKVLRRKMPAFKDAPIVTDYKGIRDRIAGKEVLASNMDISLASIADAVHLVTIPLKRDEIEALAAMGEQQAVETILMETYPARTYTSEQSTYSAWLIDQAKKAKEDADIAADADKF